MRDLRIAIVALVGVALGGIAAGASPLLAAELAAAQPRTVPHAVAVARTTTIPVCTLFVDAAAAAGGTGTAARPLKTIAAAVTRASAGAIICVAQGVYAENIRPGTKPFTLAGGFQRGKNFKVRDSALYVSKAQGAGGSFVKIVDPGPTGTQLTAVDGFEITGYSQAIVRDFYISQRFNITNNYIHDNVCRQANSPAPALRWPTTTGYDPRQCLPAQSLLPRRSGLPERQPERKHSLGRQQPGRGRTPERSRPPRMAAGSTSSSTS